MLRRHFLKNLALGTSSVLWPGAKVFAAPQDYVGRFLVTLHVEGAWDVSCFCDPKKNILGEAPINNWSNSADIESAGHLQYAPVADNRLFFNKYYKDILIVNGVDSQTNAHSTGILHNWSGINLAGYPSITALHAAVQAPQLPLAYMTFGGYSETAKMIRAVRLYDGQSLRKALTPNQVEYSANQAYLDPDMLRIVQKHSADRAQRLKAQPHNLPHTEYALEAYVDAASKAHKLDDFAAQLPASNQMEKRIRVTEEVNSELRSQIQMTLLAFKSGTGCSADLRMTGFDTHSDHDRRHLPLLQHLTQCLDYFWTYAEQLNIAHRITLMVGSDFSRTPYYNTDAGKDHWPISSFMFMEKNAAWGNKQIHATDDLQNAVAVNPTTLLPDAKGIILHPGHIHHALREHLGLNQNSLLQKFELQNSQAIPLFMAS